MAHKATSYLGVLPHFQRVKLDSMEGAALNSAALAAISEYNIKLQSLPSLAQIWEIRQRAHYLTCISEITAEYIDRRSDA